MTHIDAMKQGLEALEEAVHYTSAPVWSPSMTKECNEAITSLRQAIAEAEREPRTDLIDRLRDTASKGVSVWGDLMLEAAKEIEILTAERECYASAMDRMLAQPEQEPVAIDAYKPQRTEQEQSFPSAMKTVIKAMQSDPDYAWAWHCNIAMAFVDAGGDSYTGNQGAARFMKLFANVEPAYKLPAQSDQEPVIDKSAAIRIATALGWEPKREWVGLTDEEIEAIWYAFHDREMGYAMRFTRAIEAKLKQKNGYAEENT